MSRQRIKLAYWVLVFAILVQAATSDAARAEDPAPPSPWSFQIVPYLWLAGIGGDISGPRESVSVSAGIGDVLSHLDGGLMLLGEAPAAGLFCRLSPIPPQSPWPIRSSPVASFCRSMTARPPGLPAFMVTSAAARTATSRGSSSAGSVTTSTRPSQASRAIAIWRSNIPQATTASESTSKVRWWGSPFGSEWAGRTSQHNL